VPVLREATNPGGIGQFAAIQSADATHGMEVRPIDGGSDAGAISRARFQPTASTILRTSWTSVSSSVSAC
jgi:hypothetical protein